MQRVLKRHISTGAWIYMIKDDGGITVAAQNNISHMLAKQKVIRKMILVMEYASRIGNCLLKIGKT
ncbi:hypothetical protein MKX01_009803, partial [Papaver californicum]